MMHKECAEEAARICERFGGVKDGYVCAKEILAAASTEPVSEGKLVKLADVLRVIGHNEEQAKLAGDGWEKGFAAAIRSIDALVRELPRHTIANHASTESVPVEPTKEMMEAWFRAYEKGEWSADSWNSAFSLAYKAMLAAAKEGKK